LIGNIGEHADSGREIPNRTIFWTKSRGIQEKNRISNGNHRTIHISLDTVFLQEVPMCERSEHQTEATQGKTLKIVQMTNDRSDPEKGNRVKGLSRDIGWCYNF
jgi:hypothetical protein